MKRIKEPNHRENGGLVLLTPMVIRENAMKNHFTAKPPRTQRTYNEKYLHPFGEALEHLKFESKP
jgi:hypothetical protein